MQKTLRTVFVYETLRVGKKSDVFFCGNNCENILYIKRRIYSYTPLNRIYFKWQKENISLEVVCTI